MVVNNLTVFVSKNAYKLTACALILIIIPSLFVYMYKVTALSMAKSTISSSGIVVQNYTGNLTQLLVEGRYTKDSSGNVVFLRGVNVATYLDATTGWWYNGGSYYGIWNEENLRLHLQEMKDWGINHMRILICIEWWINNFQGTLGGQPADRPYRDSIKDTIVIAQEYGIYVVIVPWSVAVGEADGYTYPPPAPYPPHTSHSEVIPDTQAFVDFWVNVANELKVYPNVLFELWNEPAADIDTWFSVAQQCIDAIRAIPDDHIIIVQWGYSGGLQWLRRPDLPTGINVLYSEHIYRFHGSLYNNGYTYDDVYDALYYDHYGWLGDYQYAVENNIPMWIGEIGCWIAYDPDPQEKEAFINTLKILNEWEMGYSIWDWFICPGRPFGVLAVTDVPSPNLSGQILIHAIAGVPT